MISKKTFAMKNSNSNEVSTIFHPKKCRPSVLTHCDEQQNNEIDTTQKTDDPHYCNLTSECINNCRTSDSINSSVPGNAINNVTNTAVIGCGINTNQCPSQNQPIFQFRTHSNNSYSYRGSLSTFYQSCCAALAKKIVAVILCDTGIALLAYMDGITGSPTLGGVVLAASAAAGSAVYKVLFKKVIGDTTFGEISLFFSIIGICNAALLWPICLVLYFSGVEYILWEKFPWIVLLAASILHLAANMLGNFSIAVTYNLFVTLGLITAVPVSAALDVILYGAHFMGMKLAGMILIAIGFFLVMFPNNWPDYFTRLLRWSRRHRHGISGGTSRDIIDYRTGYIKSHLRSPSGRVR
ncbi:PREDICTED: putative thiamine transporter SLC35F3 isoform X5 [Ceratosolen solmsi marchali]|uniref:Thiamine transporter SLC35F3 isoform X5 n=1 Tax=Ceratosolen solmsi marchali TaxID=326594 RepID=A0AAJ7DTR2_9HYME|nr:PREDICTED: putative thiamine transporter SLC35F3 isoform X5 [Ceratosolen solmsi marchali]